MTRDITTFKHIGDIGFEGCRRAAARQNSGRARRDESRVRLMNVITCSPQVPRRSQLAFTASGKDKFGRASAKSKYPTRDHYGNKGPLLSSVAPRFCCACPSWSWSWCLSEQLRYAFRRANVDCGIVYVKEGKGFTVENPHGMRTLGKRQPEYFAFRRGCRFPCGGTSGCLSRSCVHIPMLGRLARQCR